VTTPAGTEANPVATAKSLSATETVVARVEAAAPSPAVACSDEEQAPIANPVTATRPSAAARREHRLNRQ
jgi:hypothetical protein